MTFKVGAVKTSPGYWFRLTPNGLILGAGMHMLDKPELERYRKAVDADGSGAELAKIVAKEERAGYGFAASITSAYRLDPTRSTRARCCCVTPASTSAPT
jgi:predicted nicotinamide N-methyase